MKVIRISDEDFELLVNLMNAHDEYYVDSSSKNWQWSFQDLVDVQEIGQNFIQIIKPYLLEPQDA
jgi:hypothetical protein